MRPFYLLDTSVLSAFAPGRPAADSAFAEWIGARHDRFYLSTITIVEIEQGIRKLKRAGGVARADKLSEWLDTTLTIFGDRILPVDAAVARTAGAMADAAIADGKYPGLADILIAATARAHHATILTRNGKHFAALAIAFADPFEKLPD